LIIIKYDNGFITFRAETIDDNNKFIYLFQGFKGMQYKGEGSWAISANHANEISVKLLPIKNICKIDNSLVEWRKQNAAAKSPLLIRCGVVSSKIYKGGYDIPHKDIEEATRYFWKPAVNNQKFKDGKWDGYINLYKRWEHSFPTGILHLVTGLLDKKNIKYKVEYMYNRTPKKQFNWDINDNIIPDPDQIEAIDACVKGLRGICKAPTGFGKTAILAKRLIALHGVPTLFVANKKTLLDDATKEFSEIVGVKDKDIIQIKDGWFGAQKITGATPASQIEPLVAPIMVATIQSLHARIQDERTKPYLMEWLHDVCKFIMVDETQAVGTKIWDEVLDECQAPYRIFLSATPRRTDGATLKLTAGSGPVLFTTTAEEQIEKGRLCELDIDYMVYDQKLYNDFDTDVNYNDMYKLCISENEERNQKCIVEPVFKMLKEERHVLVLVQRIEHGHTLKQMFIEKGIKVDDIRFIWGDTPDKIRTNAISEFRKGDFKIMIGSTIFDAGVNIPLISGVVLAGAGNSDITLIQRIGRGARNCDYNDLLGYLPDFMQKNHGKKITKVVDIMDVNTKFFYKQAKNRYYNACEEFGKSRVHIVGGDGNTLRKKTKQSVVLDKQIDQFSSQLAMLEEFKKE
jgi:superfamily II DNA or RNA helicase